MAAADSVRFRGKNGKTTTIGARAASKLLVGSQRSESGS